MAALLKTIEVPEELQGTAHLARIEIFEDCVKAYTDEDAALACWRFAECRDVRVTRAGEGASEARVIFDGCACERTLAFCVPADDAARADNFALLVGGLVRQAFVKHHGPVVVAQEKKTEKTPEREEEPPFVRTLFSYAGDRLRSMLPRGKKEKPLSRKKLLAKSFLTLLFGVISLALVLFLGASEKRFFYGSPFILLFAVLAVNNAAFTLRRRKSVGGVLSVVAFVLALPGLVAGVCGLLAFLAFPVVLMIRYNGKMPNLTEFLQPYQKKP